MTKLTHRYRQDLEALDAGLAARDLAKVSVAIEFLRSQPYRKTVSALIAAADDIADDLREQGGASDELVAEVRTGIANLLNPQGGR